MIESINLKIVIILTIGFTLASLLGYFTQRIKLSPILGYLLAGYVIGPFFPGYVADLQLAEQLAEVGVMLMMFEVGLHFKWQDLFNVTKIAVPGAIGQTFIATIVATAIVYYIWGSWEIGLIFGLAIGVASTVVLVRTLVEYNLLNTIQGHIAVGWLIVEDILTVAVLILLPTIVALLMGTSISLQEILSALALVLLKLAFLAAFMFTLGKRIVSYALLNITRLNSPELFTVTVLALTFFIATSSAFLFGTSIALGAFIAGMVIGQTEVRHQAVITASSMKDAFVVIFFISVGLLFNPQAVADHFVLFLLILLTILVVKPLSAFVIVILMRYPVSVALSVAFALAQIGEFSFILAEEAGRFGIFPDEGYDIIVACALVSISLNPLFFKLAENFKPRILQRESSKLEHILHNLSKTKPKAIVIGFKSVGENTVKVLEKLGYWPIIIEEDMDIVKKLAEQQYEAIYKENVLTQLLNVDQIKAAKLFIISHLDFNEMLMLIQHIRAIHPDIMIIASVQSMKEHTILDQMGVKSIWTEEETSKAFSRVLLETTRKVYI